MAKPTRHVASEGEIDQRWLQGMDGRRLYEYVLSKNCTPVFVEILLFISFCCTLAFCLIVIYEISLSYNVYIKYKVRMFDNSVKFNCLIC